MKSRNAWPSVLGGMVLALALWPGCSCNSDESVTPTTATGTGGQGGTTSTTTTSEGGGGGGGGGQGGGGAGGAPAGGVQSTDSVSAGNVAQSQSYTMVFTFGQPTQHQGEANSASYRLQGGLVGANGSLP